MFNLLKKRLYFWIARYFRFWGRIALGRWKPTVIVVTGSAGKTTLLHLLESQLGDKAHYSHHANSAFGIPFDILGLGGVSQSRKDWLKNIALAPSRAFRKPHTEKFYVAEVDADRSNEAAFIAQLLKPDITLWVSSLHTHTAGFDRAVKQGQFSSADEAVAHEYGNLVAATKKLVLYDGESQLMQKQMARTKAKTEGIARKMLEHYKLTMHGTALQISKQAVVLPAVVPRATFVQIAMVIKLLDQLDLPLDGSFSKLRMPPGRSSILRGKHGTTIVDSTYNNSNVDSLREIIEMFTAYPAKHKWAVLGDMLEQGVDEEAEHHKLVPVLNATKFDRLILVGKRINAFVAPQLETTLRKRTTVVSFDHPKQVKAYLDKELKGGEAVLLKGAGYLEAVVESLLANPKDERLLVRREALAAKRRKEFGL